MWLSGIRPQTLILGVIPVVSITAFVYQPLMIFNRGGSISRKACPIFGLRPPAGDEEGWGECIVQPSRFWMVATLCLAVVLFLQIAANLLNDYHDGIRGTDQNRGQEAPARLLARGATPRLVLAAGLISLGIACLAGLAVVVITGLWQLLLLGVLSAGAVWFYTGGPHPYGYSGWGEAVAFLFFGPIACLGIQLALTGRYPWNYLPMAAVGASLLSGVLAVCLMMINNLRDLENDQAHGKNTLMVSIGFSRGQRILIFFLWFAFILLALLVYSQTLTFWALLHGKSLAGRFSLGFLIFVEVLSLIVTVACLVIILVMTTAIKERRYKRALQCMSLLILLSICITAIFGFFFGGL